MSDTCTILKNYIDENFSHDMLLPKELGNHVATCEACKQYYIEIEALQAATQLPDFKVEANQVMIRQALDIGIKKRNRKINFYQNILFVICALLLFSVLGMIIGLGYSKWLLGLQGALFLIGPVIIPFSIRRQLKGGLS